MLIIEQPKILVNKFGIPVAVGIHTWDDPKITAFRMPSFMYENIEGWIHEFTENSLWFLLMSKFKMSKENLIVQISPVKHFPCHIITALHTVSILREKLGQLIEPDEYAGYVLTKYKSLSEKWGFKNGKRS